ncbi:hypothetical protein N9182_01360, partial [bacterium]|nr:hypothetical protein [bacterium]
MNSQSTINLVARTNGVGLDRDVDLVARALEGAGYKVVKSHSRGISPWKAIFASPKKKYTANIFMERVFPRWIGSAEVNVLIPNQ